MKKIILMVAVVGITTVSLFAQGNQQQHKSPEERSERIVEKMKTDLTLSDDQVSKLKPVILKREKQREELRAKTEAERENRKKMANETEEELKKIFSPEQMEKLKRQRSEKRAQHKHEHKKLE